MGKGFTIEEKTDYPYEDTVRFSFTLSQELEMPFRIRIPGWCRQPAFRLNGTPVQPRIEHGFAVFERKWHDGDLIECEYPASFELKSCRQWRWLERGPLVFALPVKAQIERESDDFLARLRFYPESEWNIALVLEPEQAKSLRLKKGEDGTPCVEVPVRKLLGGGELNQGRYTPAIPLCYHLTGPVKRVMLRPMGTSELRVTAFPDAIERQPLPVLECYAWAQCFLFNRYVPLEQQCFDPENLFGYDFVQKAGPIPVQCSPDGSFDLGNFYRTGNNVLAYIQLSIWADQPGPAMLALATADCAIGWLNGEKILRTHAINEMEPPYEEWFDIQLAKGMNFLKLKVADCPQISQYRRAWGVSARVFRT